MDSANEIASSLTNNSEDQSVKSQTAGNTPHTQNIKRFSIKITPREESIMNNILTNLQTPMRTLSKIQAPIRKLQNMNEPINPPNDSINISQFPSHDDRIKSTIDNETPGLKTLLDQPDLTILINNLPENWVIQKIDTQGELNINVAKFQNEPIPTFNNQ